jgi:hypothetical protein
MNHDGCCSYSPSPLPTRVVEIVDKDCLKLNISKDTVPYTALSYSWGGDQTFATTRETLQDRCNGFRLEDIPQTLQEAIRVTRELGIKYIWIDSMCIVQDSTEDKERELSQMPRIYSNAYVTICASYAGSCKQGFLEMNGECDKHPGTGLTKDLFKQQYRCPNGSLDTVFLREEVYYSSSNDLGSTRAWTLQERLLSPRVISYGTRLMWYCRSLRHCDGGSEDWSYDEIGNQLSSFHPPTSRTTPELDRAPLDIFSKHRLYNSWYNVVVEYSRRDLTVASDKLPALAGMAEEFQRLTGDTYLAGLWKNNLCFDLMWSPNPAIRLIKPATWRAPSWSWASIENVVSFDKVTPDSKPLARIVHCETKPRSQLVPFGEVTSGLLEISALLVKADPLLVRDMMQEEEAAVPRPHESEDDKEILKSQFSHWGHKPDDTIVPFRPKDHTVDTLMEEFWKWERSQKWQPPQEVWCLVMFSRDWYWNMVKKTKELDTLCYSGLVLKRGDGGEEQGPFERIGCFHNQKRKWLGEGRRETVTIV